MKKIILAMLVIGLFAFYSLHERQEGSEVSLPAKNTSSSTPSTNTPTTSAGSGTIYKDGTYTGKVADAFYGNVQVKAVIANGKITDVVFLQFPNDRQTSVEISNQSMPVLKSEAIQNQTANVDVVTGATQTSEAFVQTMQSALDQAKG